jgi:hypothetical protein
MRIFQESGGFFPVGNVTLQEVNESLCRFIHLSLDLSFAFTWPPPELAPFAKLALAVFPQGGARAAASSFRNCEAFRSFHAEESRNPAPGLQQEREEWGRSGRIAH